MTFYDFIKAHGIKYAHVSEFLTENKLQYAEYNRDKSGLVSGFNKGNPTLRLGQLNPRPGKYVVYAVPKRNVPFEAGLGVEFQATRLMTNLQPGITIFISEQRPNTTKLNKILGPQGKWIQTAKNGPRNEYITYRIV